MSKITDEMRNDIEQEWHGPRHETRVIEYIERPEFKTTIMFYRVNYPGSTYSTIRVKVRMENTGYGNQVDSSGDILEAMGR